MNADMNYQLAVGINTRWKSSAGAAARAVATGLFPQVAPQGQGTPYVTFAFISSSAEWAMKSPDPLHIDIPLVQFSSWDDQSNPDRAMQLGGLVGALYNDSLLSLTGFATIRADKIGERTLEEPDMKGFQHIVEVRYRLES